MEIPHVVETIHDVEISCVVETIHVVEISCVVEMRRAIPPLVSVT